MAEEPTLENPPEIPEKVSDGEATSATPKLEALLNPTLFDSLVHEEEERGSAGGQVNEEEAKAEEKAKSEEGTKSEEEAKAEEENKSEEGTKSEEEAKAEEKNKSEDGTKSEEEAKAEEKAKSEDGTKSEEEAKAEEKDKSEEGTKSEEEAKAEEKAKSEDGTKSEEEAKAEEKNKSEEGTKSGEPILKLANILTPTILEKTLAVEDEEESEADSLDLELPELVTPKDEQALEIRPPSDVPSDRAPRPQIPDILREAVEKMEPDLLSSDLDDGYPLEPRLPHIEMKTVASIEPSTSRVRPPLPTLPRVKPRPPGAGTARKAQYRLSTPVRPEVSAQQKKLMEKAMKGENLAGLDQPVYEELIFNLGQERKERAAEHKYKEGQKINEAIQYVEGYLTKLKKKNMQKEALEDFKRQKKEFDEQVIEFDNETKRLEKELKDTIDKQRNDLKQTHAEQVKDLEERWTSPAKFRQYNRASNALTVLRRQQAFLLVQCRFPEAEAVNELIQQRTKEEEQANHAAHQKAYNESLKYLEEKQKSEMDFFEENAQVQIANLAQKRARLRYRMENKEKKIEARGEIVNDTEKLWNKSQMQRLEDLTVTMTRASNSSTLPSSKMTRKDIQDRDFVILALPPLNLKSKRPQTKGKRVREE